MRKMLVGLAAVALSAGCQEEMCRRGETRCHGNGVEICDADGNWCGVAHCGDVTASEEPVWACCELQRDGDAGVIHACVPESACGAEEER